MRRPTAPAFTLPPSTLGNLGFEFSGPNPKVGGVSSSKYRVRRATLDDIGQLTALWDSMQYPTQDLARRVTEFQVAEGPDGTVLGALGLQIAERQGRVHSEAFSDFALADHLRPLLWDRMQAVATNQGLLRLWTQEQAPFWNHCGLVKPDAEALEKLPALWRGSSPAWLTLKLKDDVEIVVSLDKEFAQFMQSEKQRTEQVFRHARALKTFATLMAFALLIAVVAWAVTLFMRNPALLHR
jgi:N-acetylglutamate synthase-like GNAT family acetyltransferase